MKQIFFRQVAFLSGAGITRTLHEVLWIHIMKVSCHLCHFIFHFIDSGQTLLNRFSHFMLLLTVMVFLLLRRPIYGIGVGTVVSAFLLGRIIGIYEKRFAFLFCFISGDKACER